MLGFITTTSGMATDLGLTFPNEEVSVMFSSAEHLEKKKRNEKKQKNKQIYKYFGMSSKEIKKKYK